MALALVLLKLFEPRIRKAFVYHLLDGWIFSWQLAAGRRPEFEGRLDAFARRVAAAIRDTDAEEVLIVGHSTGTTVAVEVAARALALDPELARHGPALALLTIGSCLPVVGFVRTADRLRRHIARLATDASLLWVEYQAPQDVLNAFGFDPVRDLDLDLGGAARVNPIIRSARFKETILPSTYRRMRWNFFRVHFHFLMPNEIPGEYDYPMIVCGPVSLADRIADPAAAVRAAYGTEPGRAHQSRQSAAAALAHSAARLDRHRERVARAQCQPAHRLDHGAGREAQPGSLGQCREAEDRLGQPKGLPGADPRPDAERNIAVALPCPGILGQKPRGDEVVGLVPKLPMAVQQPRHDRDERALWDLAAADLLVPQCLAPEERDRRVQPDRLLEHRSRKDELRHIVERRQSAAQYRVQFGMQPSFFFRRLRQQKPAPGERVRGRLVPGHEDDRRLVAQCLGIEPRAGFGITRLEQ